MCGIIAYLGLKQAAQILLNGLKRLEYRGYDSAGVGFIRDDNKALHIIRRVGKVSNLAEACSNLDYKCTTGIAHTRWATHGEPSNANSHPHASMQGDLCVVHNGIVENYVSLRQQLVAKGYKFSSQTDTEVIVHLIDDVLKQFQVSLFEAVRVALTQIEGTFGIAVLSSRFPGVMIGARKGSPLLLGLNKDKAGQINEMFLASDASAIIEHTNNVIYLKDNDVCRLSRKNGYTIQTLKKATVPREITVLRMKRSAIEKGGYKHFMLKEIYDQPRCLRECIRGRLDPSGMTLKLGGLEKHGRRLYSAKRIIICACGTSWHAGLLGEYLIEKFARIPVEVEYASEFRYKNPILDPSTDVVMVISQSGETADTLAAVAEAKRRGVLTVGIVNTVGSTIARETDCGLYLHAGPEIGVASTKAFSAQVMTLSMLALKMGHERKVISDAQLQVHLKQLNHLPSQIDAVLKSTSTDIMKAAKVFRYASNFLYLGRGFNFPVALEGALKLKEISYIHAEGYPAAEMKHGPIALIDTFMPVVIIAPKVDATYEKIVANVQEVLARKGVVIIITEEDNHDFDDQVEYVFRIPKTSECFMPLLTVIPLQLLSYYIADSRGLNVDRPRNLAKSVTVE